MSEKIKVKIIRYHGYYDDNSWLQGISDWEEVTPEEYDELIRWIYKKNGKARDGGSWTLISQQELPSKIDIADFLKEERAKEKERQKKAKERAKKAKATRERKQREKELAQLKELKEKYGDDES